MNVVRLLQEAVHGMPALPRKPGGVVHLCFVGLDDESWTVRIDRVNGCSVSPGAPATSHVQLYCQRSKLEALLQGAGQLDCSAAPMRFAGSREVLEHFSELLATGKSLVALRTRYQAKHHAEHYRDELALAAGVGVFPGETP